MVGGKKKEKPPFNARSQIQQVIIIIVPALSPAHNNLLLLLVVRHSRQQVFKLSLRHLLPQLARLRQCKKPVLDVDGALLLDESDAAETVSGLGVEDLVEHLLPGFVCLSGVSRLACFESLSSGAEDEIMNELTVSVSLRPGLKLRHCESLHHRLPAP